MRFSTVQLAAVLPQESDVFGCTTFGRAKGLTLIDEFPVVIGQEKPADTTI
jgi:hypothetical protein